MFSAACCVQCTTREPLPYLLVLVVWITLRNDHTPHESATNACGRTDGQSCTCRPAYERTVEAYLARSRRCQVRPRGLEQCIYRKYSTMQSSSPRGDRTAKSQRGKQGQVRGELRSVTLSRDAALAFLYADVDGSQYLSWDEFLLCVPMQIKNEMTQAQLRELFDAVDLNGNGSISMDEYFLWTLRVAGAQTGSSLEAIFRRYDKTGEGALDLSEFQQACDEMGFGMRAHDLFMSLDSDHSGMLHYGELLDELDSRTGHGRKMVNNDAKKFIAALAMHNSRELTPEEISRLDTSSWVISARDERGLRKSLGQLMMANGLRVSDFHRMVSMHLARVDDGEADEECAGKHLIPRHAFLDVMHGLGFGRWKTGKTEAEEIEESTLAYEIFDTIDQSRDGYIQISELYAWIDGAVSRRHAASNLTLMAGRPDGELGLDEIEWTTDELRRQVQLMLLWNQLSPLDLLAKYDVAGAKKSEGGDGKFSFKEFLVMMKKLIQPGDEFIVVWDADIRPVVQQSFRELAGDDGKLDVVELETWLTKDWHERAAQVTRLREQHEVEVQRHHLESADFLETMNTRKQGKAWLEAARRKNEERLAAATRLAALTHPSRQPTASRRRPPPPKPKAAPKSTTASSLPPDDRQPGWEVRSYLAKVCEIAQVQRHPYDQRRLLDGAYRELRQKQREDRAAIYVYKGVAYEF